MKRKILKMIIPLVLVLLMLSVLGSLYLFVYLPLKKDCDELQAKIDAETDFLQRLRVIESNQKLYEAELFEYKKIIGKYNLYYEEYGSYPKLIMLLADVERRVGAELISLNRVENDIQLIINTNYKSLKDFLVELESIEFFYNCSSLNIARIDGNQFTINEISVDSEWKNDMLVELTATFSKDLEFDMAIKENEIKKLLEDLGFENAVIIDE